MREIVFGKLSHNLAARLEQCASMCLNFFDIAIAQHLYTRCYLTQIVAQQINNGSVFCFFFDIIHQLLFSLQLSAIYGSLHWKCANHSFRNFDKRFGRKAHEMVVPQQFIWSTSKTIKLLKREIGGNWHGKGQIRKKTISAMQMMLHFLESAFVVAQRRRCDFPFYLRGNRRNLL